MKKQQVKRHLIALFLNKGDSSSVDWIRIKKSTALELSLNPTTEENHYIADEFPTKELTGYNPSINQSLKMFKGDDDYALIFDRFFNLQTGEEAKAEVLLVFFQEKSVVNTGSEDKSYFKAWKTEATIALQNINTVESSITFDILFGGSIEKGYIEEVAKKPVFTEGAIPS